MMSHQLHEYIVVAKRAETVTVTTIFLRRSDGVIPVFLPGQYVTVYLKVDNATIGKQYSISSAPSEFLFTITVKAVGEFSRKLSSIQVGAILLLSEPQGAFLPTTNRKLILIAGGVGITPFRSIIYDSIIAKTSRRIVLLYTGRCIDDMPFTTELAMLSELEYSLSVYYFITKDQNQRIEVRDIYQAAAGELVEYLISGSLSFVVEFKKLLLLQGVMPKYISTQAHS